MKFTKQIISTVLLLALVFSMAPTNIIAAETKTITESGTCGDNVFWELYSDGFLRIHGSGAMQDYTGSKSAPWYGKTVTEVLVEEGVTYIGKYAFYRCDSLTSISIQDSVTSIGYAAFCRCTSLTSISLSDSITYIGGDAFSECTSLTSIAIPDSVTRIGFSAFHNCPDLNTVYITDIDSWFGIRFEDEDANPLCNGAKLYLNGQLVENLVIPDSVTSINSSAFCGCTSLTSVSIPEGVPLIDSHTFYNCTSLTSISIPDGITEISGSAFNGCVSLTSISIPEGVAYIGNYAFRGCASLTSISIPDSVTSVGGGAFSDCTSLKKITFQGNAPSIGGTAFENVTATAYYPEGNKTWTSDDLENYGGTITWVVGIPRVAIVQDTGAVSYYTGLEQAVAAYEQGVITLLEDISDPLTLSKTITLDLNGFQLTDAITVAENCTLFVKDSQTDDFTIADGNGYGKLTSASGTVVAADGYMMIREDAGISFHKVDLKIESMVVRASDVGVYYKSNFCGDEVVAENVARYGVAFGVNSAPDAVTEENASWYASFASGAEGNGANGTLLYGIMKSGYSDRNNAARAESDIYGSAYILTNDGQCIFGESVSRTFREQVELIDTQWSTLTTEQQNAVLAMYRAYSAIIGKWDIPNILSEKI